MVTDGFSQLVGKSVFCLEIEGNSRAGNNRSLEQSSSNHNPVVSTVCGCDCGVCTIGDQPLEDGACPKANGRPLGGSDVAAASIEISHEHDVLPGDMTCLLVQGQTGPIEPTAPRMVSPPGPTFAGHLGKHRRGHQSLSQLLLGLHARARSQTLGPLRRSSHPIVSVQRPG